jgi:hypothetical protein
MLFTASRMCCSGDEHTLPVEHQDNKDDDGYETPSVPTMRLPHSNADSGSSTLSPSGIYTRRLISPVSTNPLKNSVHRPQKATYQLDKEYFENISALTDCDEADWLEAVTLLEMNRSDDALY